MIIWKTFRFEAAHQLDRMPVGHKCRTMHGHSYRVEIHVEGAVNADDGMVCDYADISAAVKPLVKELDHSTLNNTITVPTAENIAAWFGEALRRKLPGLVSVVVQETEDCGAVWSATRGAV